MIVVEIVNAIVCDGKFNGHSNFVKFGEVNKDNITQRFPSK